MRMADSPTGNGDEIGVGVTLRSGGARRPLCCCALLYGVHAKCQAADVALRQLLRRPLLRRSLLLRSIHHILNIDT